MNVRPSDPADFERLVELYKLGFKLQSDAPFLRLDIMRWKYWESRADWSEPRSYVVERDGRLLGHVAAWPATLHCGGRELRGMQIYDWVADPSSSGAGRKLLRHMNQVFDFVYAIGGQPRAVAMLPHLGFSQVGTSWKAALPLRPLQMLQHRCYYGPRLAGRVLRNLVWSVTRRPDPAWSFEAADPGALPEAPLQIAGFTRRAEFFRYLARCPGRDCFTYRALHRGAPAGFFVLMRVRHHLRAAVWLDNPVPGSFQAIYALAVQAARAHPGGLELAVAGSSRETAAAATAAGFRIRATAPINWSKPREPWPGPPPTLEYQMSDTDGVFFDDGGPQALC